MGEAKFVKGNTLKHLLVMTLSSTVGLVAIFAVDLVDMYFLSLLGQQELAAAVGFSGTLIFFLTSVGIGIQIAMGSLVSRAEGDNDRDLVRQFSSSVMLFSAIFTTLVTIPAWYFLEELLVFLGASGPTLQYAINYSEILLPSTPILAIGMSAAATLRGVGDAKTAMYTTLGAAFINAILNPIFIFGLGLDIQGAAIASVISRITLMFIGLYGVTIKHNLNCKPNLSRMIKDLPIILPIATPAILANLATPLGGSFVLKTMASFGDSAVAGAAILGRITPLAFALIFALSGAVGPIIGQNVGAERYDRVRFTLYNALLVNFIYIFVVWLVLYSSKGLIISAFGAKDQAAHLIDFYTTWLVLGFAFNGVLFIANATSNNLGKATQATAFNFARTLLGTIPFVFLLASMYGAKGVLIGELAGGFLWGSIALVIVLIQVKTLENRPATVAPAIYPVTNEMSSTYSSAQCHLGCDYVKDKEC